MNRSKVTQMSLGIVLQSYTSNRCIFTSRLEKNEDYACCFITWILFFYNFMVDFFFNLIELFQIIESFELKLAQILLDF